MNKKCLLILLDGLGDRSYPQFDHQTPLQAANTPILNDIARSGANGLYHAAALGQALPSENAHFAMFGYDMGDFPGRGALEALGAGIPLSAKNVAVLGHFASLHEKKRHLTLVDGKLSATDEEATELFKTVGDYETEEIRIQFHRTHGLYGIIVLQGPVTPFVTDTDPFIKGRLVSDARPWHTHEADGNTIQTATALKRYLCWAWRKLADHPVNKRRRKKGLSDITGIVTQRAGQLRTPPPFSESWGLRGLSMASGIVYQGLASYIGLDFLRVSDTGDPGADMADRLRMAYNALNDYDFIHLHTKTPDESAHTKDPTAKKTVIESLDRGIGQAITPFIKDPQMLVVVTSDHSTPSAGPLIHSGEPVPILFTGEGVRQDAVQQFDEISAAGGALGVVRGKEFMYLVLNHLDLAKLHGVMDTAKDQPFWPGNYHPFEVS